MWIELGCAFGGLLLGVLCARLFVHRKPPKLVAPAAPRSSQTRSLSTPTHDEGWAEVVDVLQDPVCLIDRQGNVLRANRAFAAAAGALDGHARGLHLAPLINPKTPNELPAEGPIALAMRTQRPASGIVGPCRFGVEVRMTAIPIDPSRGGRISAVSTIQVFAIVLRDLSDARGQEDRVRHLGHLVGALPLVVVEVDPTTNKISFVNGAFAQCFGASSDEAAIGAAIDTLASKHDAEALRALAFAGGGSTIVDLTKNDGSKFPARVSARVIRKSSGAPESLVLMIEDITRELDVIRQRELLAAAVEASKDGIVITDLFGRITYANAAATALYGREVLGLDLKGLNRGHPDFIDAERGWTGDLARSCQDEVLRPTRVTVAAVRDGASGNAVSYVAILHDITDEREMQEQVLRSQKLATLGELAATLNHEISNPLTFLLANTAYVFEELEKNGAREELLAAARESLDGAERIQAIVTEVRRFAHMGKGGRRTTTFETAIESALAIVGRRAADHAEIVRPKGPPVDVWADPQQLTQVVLNLIVNAAQALEDTGKKGTIRFEQGVVDNYGYLRVTDDGPGIPDSVRSRLFKDYVTTKEPGRGTGFGLRISQKLVQANGGEIHVDSTSGLGTTITIAFPRTEKSGRVTIPTQRTDPSWSAFETRLQVALTGDLPSRKTAP